MAAGDVAQEMQHDNIDIVIVGWRLDIMYGTAAVQANVDSVI